MCDSWIFDIKALYMMTSSADRCALSTIPCRVFQRRRRSDAIVNNELAMFEFHYKHLNFVSRNLHCGFILVSRVLVLRNQNLVYLYLFTYQNLKILKCIHDPSILV